MRRTILATAVAAFLAAGLSAPAIAATAEAPPSLSVVTPAPLATPATVHINNARLSAGARLHLRGTIQIVDATAAVSAAGVVTPEVADAAYLLVGANGRIRLDGTLPAGVASGSSFDGTLALSGAAAKASTTRAVDVATESQEALTIASATIVAPQAVVTTPMKHTFYVAVVAAKGSRYSSSAYSSTNVKKLTAKIAAYWKAQSGGAVAAITVKRIVHFRSSASCAAGQSAVSTWWSESARKLGHTASYFGRGTGRHLVALVPDGPNGNGGCGTKLGFVGLAGVGSSPSDGGMIQVLVGSTIGAPSFAHEFGHNMSLAHADVQFCASETVGEAPGTVLRSDDATCKTAPYEDYYDVMGASMYGQAGIPSLSLPQKDRLGFVQPADIPVAPAGTTSTYSLVPVSLVAGVRGVKVVDPLDPTITYWVEYRAPVGQDKTLVAYLNGFGVCKGNCSASPESRQWASIYGQGVRVLKLKTSVSPSETVVVGSPAANSPRWHLLARTSGESFTSVSGGVTVTVTSATSSSASVTVSVAAAN